MSSASFRPSGPHGVVGFQSLLRHGAQVGGHRFQILIRLRDGQHIRETGKAAPGVAFASVPQTSANSLPGGGILGRQLPLTVTLATSAGGVHRDEHIQSCLGK